MATRVGRPAARISAKRLLPEARAAGYTGSARNFRRLVARAKRTWRASNHRGRRPGVWAPGEVLVIDWGTEAGLHIFCAVLAFSRFRFVRFATDEKAVTTFEMLARCFEALGGVPKVVLADRMGCLKGGVVANIVVPTPAYVRFASSLWLPAGLLQAATTLSPKGSSKHLVGYAKLDLVVPQGLARASWPRPTRRPGPGARRSTPGRTPRPAPCPASASTPNGPCSAPLPSLRPSFGRRLPARSTSFPACALAAPVTRCPPS